MYGPDRGQNGARCGTIASIALGATVVAGFAGGDDGEDAKQATVRTHDTKSTHEVSIGTAAVVARETGVDIGDAASVTRDAVDAPVTVAAETTAAESIPVEVDAQPGDPAWVTRGA